MNSFKNYIVQWDTLSGIFPSFKKSAFQRKETDELEPNNVTEIEWVPFETSAVSMMNSFKNYRPMRHFGRGKSCCKEKCSENNTNEIKWQTQK